MEGKEDGKQDEPVNCITCINNKVLLEGRYLKHAVLLTKSL